MENEKLFRRKKVAVIGAGVEGLSAVSFLVKKSAVVSLLDKKKEREFERAVVRRLKKLPIDLRFGGSYLSNLASFDTVFRSPGVRPDIPEIDQARKRGIEITSQTKIFFDLCPAPIVGVTGTKGKGTTSSLIYEILKGAGKRVFLGGNIGKPPLDFVDEVTADSIVVLELSSFQLADLTRSPRIAVVLMVTSEHQDWHRNVAEYVSSKESIVKYQEGNDFAVINKDYPASRKIGEITKAKKYYFSTKEKVTVGAYIDKDFVVSVTNGWSTLAKTADIKIPGEHNLQNICAAVSVAGILEVQPQVIAKTITGFTGLPHRLEFVAEVREVKYYNDSASTTPETAVAAIAAFKAPKIVILGGSRKKSAFAPLAKVVAEANVKALILIGDEARRIRETVERGGFRGELVEGLGDMREVVAKAREIATFGDVVILSPACASFDMFENYQDRGDQFREAVKNLL